MTMSPRLRADRLLVERGLFESRTKAQAAIAAGRVSADGAPVHKASDEIARNAELAAAPAHPFVSRGGVKLAAALDAGVIDAAQRVCLDVGASTGGFTQALLERGARRVYAVDVGRGQLHPSLRDDPRVVSFERTDIRALAHRLASGGAQHFTLPLKGGGMGWGSEAACDPSPDHLRRSDPPLSGEGDAIGVARPIASEGGPERAEDMGQSKTAFDISVVWEPPSLVVIDVSFISLTLVLPAALALAAPDCRLIALIKPQFEAGRDRVKKGIVRDPQVHAAVCGDIAAIVRSLGCTVEALLPSPIEGGDGNREFLIVARRAAA